MSYPRGLWTQNLDPAKDDVLFLRDAACPPAFPSPGHPKSTRTTKKSMLTGLGPPTPSFPQGSISWDQGEIVGWGEGEKGEHGGRRAGFSPLHTWPTRTAQVRKEWSEHLRVTQPHFPPSG